MSEYSSSILESSRRKIHEFGSSETWIEQKRRDDEPRVTVDKRQSETRGCLRWNELRRRHRSRGTGVTTPPSCDWPLKEAFAADRRLAAWASHCQPYGLFRLCMLPSCKVDGCSRRFKPFEGCVTHWRN
ncbi:hypothetical protein KM043_016680 [Ampulex compressa]|nr:hypothetical protein KM043_016680 [Ampulex compressa]